MTPYILHRQLFACFIGVDGLMLRTMVLKHPLNVFHRRNSRYVPKKQNQPQRAFQQIEPNRIGHGFMNVFSRKSWQHNKQANSQHKRNQHRQHQLFGAQLLFFLPGSLRRKGQRLQTVNQGFQQSHRTAYKGQL